MIESDVSEMSDSSPLSTRPINIKNATRDYSHILAQQTRRSVPIRRRSSQESYRLPSNASNDIHVEDDQDTLSVTSQPLNEAEQNNIVDQEGSVQSHLSHLDIDQRSHSPHTQSAPFESSQACIIREPNELNQDNHDPIVIETRQIRYQELERFSRQTQPTGQQPHSSIDPEHAEAAEQVNGTDGFAEYEACSIIPTTFCESSQDYEFPDYCFLCEYTCIRHNAVQSLHVQHLLQYINENMHMCSADVWTYHAQQYYNMKIRRFTEFKLPWMRRQIFDHFDSHAPTETSMKETSLQTFNAVLRNLRDNGIFQKHTQTNKISIDAKSVHLFLRVEKQRNITLNALNGIRKNTLL